MSQYSPAVHSAIIASNDPNKRMFGFWYSDHHPQYPRVEASVCDNTELIKSLRAIEANANALQFKGISFCRICGCANGSVTYIHKVGDVVYEWPSGFIHYLEAHNINPQAYAYELCRAVAPIETQVLTAELRALLEREGYMALKEVNGIVLGLMPFATTWGVIVGLTADTYARRYCYKEFGDAAHALQEVVDPDEHASGPWIKCKGRYKGAAIDLFNPDVPEA